MLYHYKTHCLEHSQQTCQSAFLFVAVVDDCKYISCDFYGLVFVLFSFIDLFIFSVIVPAYVHFLCYRPCMFTFSVIGPVYVHFLSHWPSVCSLSQSLAKCMFIFSSHWPSVCLFFRSPAQCMFTFSVVDLFSLFLDPVFVY